MDSALHGTEFNNLFWAKWIWTSKAVAHRSFYFELFDCYITSAKYYIDYTMDFSIITPEYLTRYNQSGIMSRDIKTSNVMNIKTISIEKHSFLYNIFNNGDLIFLSEGDKADQWEIVLHYIKDPEWAKKEITRIMKLPV